MAPSKWFGTWIFWAGTTRLASRVPTKMKLISLLLLLAPFAGAQLQIDPGIAAEIAKIKAIDNHAHPVRPALGGVQDTDYDALPVENMEPYTCLLYTSRCV